MILKVVFNKLPFFRIADCITMVNGKDKWTLKFRGLSRIDKEVMCDVLEQGTEPLVMYKFRDYEVLSYVHLRELRDQDYDRQEEYQNIDNNRSVLLTNILDLAGYNEDDLKKAGASTAIWRDLKLRLLID